MPVTIIVTVTISPIIQAAAVADNINMKSKLFTIILSILMVCSFISCVGLKTVKTEKPQPPTYIMGKGKVDMDKLAQFIGKYNEFADEGHLRMMARLYYEEALFEGVNHDIAFTQMCLETGFLKFGGDVQPDQNNFAGLGAVGNGAPGLSFPDYRTGVRAHIQHLKAYGSEDPLNLELVNPRFRFVRRGCAPTYEGLAGTWAADKQYAVKIEAMLKRLYEFSF